MFSEHARLNTAIARAIARTVSKYDRTKTREGPSTFQKLPLPLPPRKSVRFESGQTRHADRRCYECQQHGHYARNCTKRSSRPPPALRNANVEIALTKEEIVDQHIRKIVPNAPPPPSLPKIRFTSSAPHFEQRPCLSNTGHVTTAPIIHTLPEKQQHILMRKLLNSRDPSLRFIASAWTRKQTDDMFLSNRKSMTLQFYAHLSRKRTEGIVLKDTGATENFMSLEYAKWLGLPIKRLPKPRTLLNVDGTLNKQGKLEYYADLQVQTGSQRQDMRFFLSNLGEQKAILGYPWFAAMQPKIDWARGWIDTLQLPIVLRAHNAHRARFLPRSVQPKPLRDEEMLLIGRISWTPEIRRQTMSSTLAEQAQKDKPNPIPAKYRQHERIISEEASQCFPEPRIWDHTIELKPGVPSTLPVEIYLLNPLEQEELRKFVQDHLSKGYICPSKSPYTSPFFFIKKKDGKLCPVQDYHCLNEWTIRNRYPLPLIPQLINCVRMKKLFTKVDVRWGYNNVRIKRGDEWKAAFITNEGLYEPTVMFFGMTNSPATFQAMMNAIFKDEIQEGWLTVYMDDMLIATNDDPTLHTKYVHRILDKLEKHDLYLKPEKCVFAQRRIEFLGVVLEGNTIQMDPTKIKGVAEWPYPRNPTDVRSFLGFTGFYRYFIPNYSKVARPLLDLTKKATPWVWTADQTKAFETLKWLMCSEPVLTQPQYDKPFVVHTDASAYGVGAILLQVGEINPKNPLKPRLHPIAYYSATFTPTERNYDIYERELLAVIKALQNWRPHLLPTTHPFTLITDHANLTFWKHPRKVNRRVARWFAELQDYDFEIKHVPGKTHTAADFLSRPFTGDKGEQDNEDVIVLPPKLFVNSAIQVFDIDSIFGDLDQTVASTQEHYPLCMKAWQKDHEITDVSMLCPPYGEIPGWRKEGKLVVPPNLSLKYKIMYHVHDAPRKHPNQASTLRQTSWYYWWPNMKDWIEKYVGNCEQCHNALPTIKTITDVPTSLRTKILRTQQRERDTLESWKATRPGTKDRDLWMKDKKIAH